MSTLAATHAKEIKNAIVDQLLIEKYQKLEASRKAAVIKYYKKNGIPTQIL